MNKYIDTITDNDTTEKNPKKKTYKLSTFWQFTIQVQYIKIVKD